MSLSGIAEVTLPMLCHRVGNENFNICLLSILTDSKSYSFIKSIKKSIHEKKHLIELGSLQM